MAFEIIRYVLSFAGLLLFQVLVLNNLDLSYYISPYIYPLIIFMLPFRISQIALMFVALVCGITIDAFCNTLGMHTAALIFVAYLRPYIVRAITPRTGYEITDKPNIRVFGFAWFLTYAGSLLLLHHFVYFFLEIFSFKNAFTTLGKIFVSTGFSLLFVVIIAYLFSRERKRL